MAEPRARARNRSPFHWHWCFQGGHGRMDQDRLHAYHQSMPDCPCNGVPASMPFIRLSWLLDPGVTLVDLPRSQDLPPDAFVFPEEMSGAYFVSHRWLETDHPDRSGSQLALAVSRTEAADLERAEDRSRRVGVFYDYLCLPQAPYSDADRARLAELLPSVFRIPAVSHPIVVLNGEVQFASRAWCVAEAIAAYLNGRHWECVSLSSQLYEHPRLGSRRCSEEQLIAVIKPAGIPGLRKLRRWLRETGGPVRPARQLILQETANWRHCVDLVGDLAIELRLRMGRRRELAVDDQHLLALAEDRGLRTTEPADLLPCMRAMAYAVRGFRDDGPATEAGTDA